MKNRKIGYTLVEMIVVVAIMSILISLTFFGLVRSRNNGRTARAKSDMVSLGYSVMAYHDANKDNSDLNEQWPRDMYQSKNLIGGLVPMVDKVPWELTEKTYWSKSEPISSGLAYERFGCSPEYGEYFKSDTQEANKTDFSEYEKVDFTSKLPGGTNRKNACAVSSGVAYVGINWLGIDRDFGLNDEAKVADNGFLLLYAATPKPELTAGQLDGHDLPKDKQVIDTNSYKYKGNFLLKMGGSDEDCTGATVCEF